MSEKEKVDKAIKLYNDGKYQEAIDAFSSVLEVCQDNAELYNNIALCYANLGEYEKAEKYYLKAQELNPKLAQVYINLADIYYRRKDSRLPEYRKNDVPGVLYEKFICV